MQESAAHELAAVQASWHMRKTQQKTRVRPQINTNNDKASISIIQVTQLAASQTVPVRPRNLILAEHPWKAG